MSPPPAASIPSPSDATVYAHKILLIIDARSSNFLPPPHGIPSGPTLLPTLQHILSKARSARDPPLIIHTRCPPELFSSPLSLSPAAAVLSVSLAGRGRSRDQDGIGSGKLNYAGYPASPSPHMHTSPGPILRPASSRASDSPSPSPLSSSSASPLSESALSSITPSPPTLLHPLPTHAQPYHISQLSLLPSPSPLSLEPNLPLSPLAYEPILSTPKNNAFVNSTLASYIPPGPSTLLIIVGCQTDFCIRATCGEALSRGNEVWLVRGAHGTFDRLDVPLEVGVKRAMERGLMRGGMALEKTEAGVVQAEIEEELEEAGVRLVEVVDVDRLFVGGE